MLVSSFVIADGYKDSYGSPSMFEKKFLRTATLGFTSRDVRVLTTDVSSGGLDNSVLSVEYMKGLVDSELDKLIISDKRAFVLFHFYTDHPNTLVKNYDELEYLLQEKRSFKKWKDQINDKWSLLNDVPEWLLPDPQLRDYWMSNFQSKLISLRLEESKTLERNNQAKAIYDQTVEKNNKALEVYQDVLYGEDPIILIHRITPSALSEADLLKLHHLNKEERKEKRKELVNQFKLELLTKYKKGDISKDELFELVK